MDHPGIIDPLAVLHLYSQLFIIGAQKSAQKRKECGVQLIGKRLSITILLNVRHKK